MDNFGKEYFDSRILFYVFKPSFSSPFLLYSSSPLLSGDFIGTPLGGSLYIYCHYFSVTYYDY